MEKDPAMWSRAFARKIGALLGFAAPECAPAETGEPNDAEKLLLEITEDLRYLPLAQWNWVEHLTQFLTEGKVSPTESVGKLREIRSYIAFLRSSHGNEQPADEDDEWSDEDLRDATLASMRYLEETDPYEWPDSSQQEADK